MSVAVPSAFERRHFDVSPVQIDRNGLDIAQLLGVALTDDDISHLSGAPAGATVVCQYKAMWAQSETGADRPDPGVYFYVTHPYISGWNCIGLAAVLAAAGTPYYRMYVKDVNFLGTGAPAGIAGVMIARIARRCLALGITEMRMLAAGGRLWNDMAPGQRWTGYSAWARYGFDMPLIQDDVTLMMKAFPFFPWHFRGTPPCLTVQDVLRTDAGLAWWKVCGTGHFMTFNCSNSTSPSITILDSVLAAKGV